MAWIETKGRDEDAAELAELFRVSADPRTGQVDNILAVHALHPAGLRAHLALYSAVMRPTAGLGRTEREMIAVVVSAANGCRY